MFGEIIAVFGYCALLTIVFVAIVYAVSMLKHRLDVADIAWGINFIVIAFTSFWVDNNEGMRGVVVTILVVAWATRLALHISRRQRSHPEDRRYVALRQRWKGAVALQAFIRVFLAQGVLALIIAAPIIIVNTTTRSRFNMLDFAGVAVWCVGYLFEAIGDKQLSHFIADPANKGKLMTTGLWRYSRHPNYFGELTQWWAIYLIALSAPYGWMGIIGPATITFLIVWVSGVPLLEKSSARRQGWEMYKARTSMIFPTIPRKGKLSTNN